MSKTRILIVGGSGYLGQHVAQELAGAPQFEVASTYSSFRPTIPNMETTFEFDASSCTAADHFASILQSFQPTVVVNCVALSDLGVSEKFPDKATRLNVPSWLAGLPSECFLIHISTDIVYNGTKARCVEEDTDPICMYGRSKLAGEEDVLRRHPNSIVLRSALIYGPAPFLGTSKSSFIQATADAIRQRKPIPCFTDEFRTPVYVKDIVRLIRALIEGRDALNLSGRRVFNMGGPDRCSRWDMAKLVADVLREGEDLLEAKRAANMHFGYSRPLDVSMDSSRLYALVPQVPFTPIRAAVAEVLGQRPSSL
eukprot:GGOE01057696.1.p1 GENE.GGOE01057696.1~~GGOE01057696.1.p1  ORF type:complete len:350 (-),score=67.10 GGOE01057696.1:128-1060(-)